MYIVRLNVSCCKLSFDFFLKVMLISRSPGRYSSRSRSRSDSSSSGGGGSDSCAEERRRSKKRSSRKPPPPPAPVQEFPVVTTVPTPTTNTSPIKTRAAVGGPSGVKSYAEDKDDSDFVDPDADTEGEHRQDEVIKVPKKKTPLPKKKPQKQRAKQASAEEEESEEEEAEEEEEEAEEEEEIPAKKVKKPTKRKLVASSKASAVPAAETKSVKKPRKTAAAASALGEPGGKGLDDSYISPVRHRPPPNAPVRGVSQAARKSTSSVKPLSSSAGGGKLSKKQQQLQRQTLLKRFDTSSLEDAEEEALERQLEEAGVRPSLVRKIERRFERRTKSSIVRQGTAENKKKLFNLFSRMLVEEDD